MTKLVPDKSLSFCLTENHENFINSWLKMIIGEIGDPLARAASNLAFTIRQTKIELQRMMYEDLDL